MVRIEWTGRFKICSAVAIVAGTAWLGERIATGPPIEAIGSVLLYAAIGFVVLLSSKGQRGTKVGILLIVFSAPWLAAIACQFAGIPVWH